MNNGLFIIGVLAVVAFVATAAKRRSVDGMQDNPVSLWNIRTGVARGWYKATLVRKNGQPGIYLYGKDADGNNYGDIFPISENDWQTLKAEGYDVAQ